MRLYAKLLLMVLTFTLVQKVFVEDRVEWWFATRCQFAHMTGDQAMEARLMDEARDELIRVLYEGDDADAKTDADDAVIFVAAAH